MTLSSDNIEQPPSSFKPGQTVEEIKYIIIVGTLYIHTVHHATTHVLVKLTYVQGTFITVRQHCSHCEDQGQLTSQPQIKDTPAGNVLLSAAILFSGATPGKVIRMFSCI